MNKRIIFWLALLLCLILSCTAIGESADGDTLPAVGDQIGGFTVQSVTPMAALGATGVLFEHEKNGAQLLYLASSDPNVSFDITFRTPALDDTGKAHVFEHMTICGSQKYLDANLFFPLCNRTYNTYVNASTYHGMTTYPLASLSEEQLMPMMDYYLSGVFEPLMKTEPRMVDREAWRYELSDADAPLTIAGTVYSEMQGALTPQRISMENIARTMFRDGLTAHVSGGVPEAIRTLTWEELATFHDAYYHPSNSLIVLYGQMDYRKFIQYIDDEYISKFDRQEVYVERGLVEPYTETAYAVFEAPVDATAPKKDASFLSYSFARNELPAEDVLALNLLSGLLNRDASPLMKLAGERMPGVNVYCALDMDMPTPVFSFYADSVNESDRDTFVKLVDDAIAQLAEGVDPELLDAVLSNAKLGLMITTEDDDLGVNASMSIALYWTYFDTTNYYADYERILDEMTVERVNALIKTYLTDNAYRGVALTVPAPGKAEENAEKLATELAEKKAAMSDAEIQQMVDQAKDFTAWSGAEPDSALIDRIAVMTVDKLPELLPQGELTDVTEDGTRFITVKADVGDLSQTVLNFDISGVPVEKLRDVEIVASLLGNVNTTEHSREELGVLVQRYLGMLTCSTSQTKAIVEGRPDTYTFDVSTLGLTEKAEQGYALVEEVLLHTDFSDVDNIRNELTRRAFDIRNSLDDDPLSFQIAHCNAVFADTAAVVKYVTGISLYDRLEELIAMAEDDPAQLTACLSDALTLVLNRWNLVVTSAGSEDANAAYKAAAKALLAKIPATETTPVDYSVLRPAKHNETIVNNLTVHMNMLAAPTEGYTGKLIPIMGLINDRYLVPRLRNVLGAYGAYVAFSKNFSYLYTYRDPNLASTYKAYEELPEYLRTVELTQADVDHYIVGSYNNLLPANGKLSQALNLASSYCQGVTDEMKLGWMREAKATTPDDVRAAAERIESMLQNGVRSISGAESTLVEAADLTDVIVRFDDANEPDEELEPAA